jgi:heme-degrading monooxygenase HmoA
VSYVVVNAITVPPGGGRELEQRFAARAGEVSKAPGFERFEFLRPANEEAGDRYLVYTRWSSKDAFEAWRSGPGFSRGHAASAAATARGPVGTASEVLAYEVIQQEGA